MPTYIVKKIRSVTKERQISRYITRIVEKDLLTSPTAPDPVESFFALRKHLPKLSYKAIKRAIEKGRT